MIYDDNDSIYMDEEAAGGCYLHVRRDSAGAISGVDVLTKEQFRELADQRMNAASDTTYEESTLMSYVDPADGRTYYSFDGGKTFEPLTDAEFEARFPTPDAVWWTYDEYKAWPDNERWSCRVCSARPAATIPGRSRRSTRPSPCMRAF
ncbi:MAG: hypothetical protein ACLUFI_12555 [Oscillospiraceae bacterium]